MTEQQPYRVVDVYGDFEVRAYPEATVAEITVQGSFERSGSTAFGSLFGYIRGHNRARQPIAMTAPVLQAEAGDGAHAVAFVMPRSLTAATAPAPDDSAVIVRSIPETTTAALRYSGSWSRSRYVCQRDRLMAGISREGLTAIGSPRFARYNPPFTPWFLRRNEVLVDIESGERA